MLLTCLLFYTFSLNLIGIYLFYSILFYLLNFLGYLFILLYFILSFKLFGILVFDLLFWFPVNCIFSLLIFFFLFRFWFSFVWKFMGYVEYHLTFSVLFLNLFHFFLPLPPSPWFCYFIPATLFFSSIFKKK